MGTLTTFAAVVSLDDLSHFDIQQETGTGNVHWLGDAGIHLIRSLLNKPEQKCRNPAAGWICFGPGLTNPGPRKTQTNFLVDNKQILSQQAAQLRVDRL